MFSKGQEPQSWIAAAKAIAQASALSEWIYLIHGVLAHANNASVSAITPLNIRAVVKEKTKEAKSKAAKKGWRKAYKHDKKLVVEHYEQHKSSYKNLSHAAEQISKANLVPLKYSTIYSWLLKYSKKLKG